MIKKVIASLERQQKLKVLVYGHKKKTLKTLIRYRFSIKKRGKLKQKKKNTKR